MIVLGRIAYKNILPLYYYLDEQPVTDRLQIESLNPAQLNERMARGEIDMGPMSSFAYAENASSYYALPNLSVSSARKVRSIYLFAKKPITELNGASIALTNASATSVALLKIIMQEFYRFSVAYEPMDPQLPLMMAKHDAALLIGDDAMWAHQQYEKEYYVYDLGEQWHLFTGRPMTFAVWAVRRATVEKYPGLVKEVLDGLLKSKQKGLRQLDNITRSLAQQYDIAQSYWHTYFSGLTYDFNQEHIDSLHYFYERALDMGLLTQKQTVKVYEPQQTALR